MSNDLPQPAARAKGARYTPVSKRQDRPDAIAWLLRHHDDIGDAQIARLIGTTKSTSQNVRDRTHWDMANIKPRNPVSLGLCTQDQLDEAVERANRARERKKKESERSERRAARAAKEQPKPDADVPVEDSETKVE